MTTNIYRLNQKIRFTVPVINTVFAQRLSPFADIFEYNKVAMNCVMKNKKTYEVKIIVSDWPRCLTTYSRIVWTLRFNSLVQYKTLAMQVWASVRVLVIWKVIYEVRECMIEQYRLLYF